MKTKPSERDQAVLWIGPTEHVEMRSLWQWCQKNGDLIAVRGSSQEAITFPPRYEVQWVLIVQTNRRGVATSPTDAMEITQIRRQNPKAKLLLVRGPLVAPTVELPPNDLSTCHSWIESISSHEAAAYLSACSQDSDKTSCDPTNRGTPIVIVASQYSIAESYIDTIELVPGQSRRWMTWQREPSAHKTRGAATILWDDSVAPPVPREDWQQRLGTAPHARHLWATGMATSAQRDVARQSGIAAIIEKPGRLECLIQAIR